MAESTPTLGEMGAMEILGVILGEVATLEMVGMVVMQEVEADTSLIVSQAKTFSLSESLGAFITSIDYPYLIIRTFIALSSFRRYRMIKEIHNAFVYGAIR